MGAMDGRSSPSTPTPCELINGRAFDPEPNSRSGLGLYLLSDPRLEKKLTEDEARMDDAELFDVFGIDNDAEAAAPAATVAAHLSQKTRKKKSKATSKNKAEQSTRKEEPATEQSTSPKGKRSHVDVIEISSDDGEAGGAVPDDSPRPAKKARKADANPVVVDSFETESDQIVRAAEGLHGEPVTDENIVIKKRVSTLLVARF